MSESTRLEDRTAIVHTAAPGTTLIVVLHGAFGTPRQASRDMALHGGPETVAYLESSPGGGRHWNAGRGENGVPCAGRAARQGVDDVGYIERAVAALREAHPNVTRTAVVGHSGGAAMAHRMAVARPALFDDVATVAGGLPAIPKEPYRGRARFLHIHGHGDRLWPATGGLRPGLFEQMRVRVPSVQQVRSYFGPRFDLRFHDHGHEWPPFATEWILAWLRDPEAAVADAPAP